MITKKEEMKIKVFENLRNVQLRVDPNYPTSFILQIRSQPDMKVIASSKEEKEEWIRLITYYKLMEEEKVQKNRGRKKKKTIQTFCDIFLIIF